ncbi:MAG: inner membrane protein [Halobacteriales archaeon]|jgi:inner membrane protein
MVADGIHILLSIALVMVLLRTDRVEPYLVGILTAALPDLDRYLFTPLIYEGYLSGAMWSHRGITHSLFAFALLVGLGYAVGYWRPAAIGHGSHLLADFWTGGIRLFAPFNLRLHGLYYDWMLGNVIVGSFASIVVTVGLGLLIYRDRTREATALATHATRWFR